MKHNYHFCDTCLTEIDFDKRTFIIFDSKIRCDEYGNITNIEGFVDLCPDCIELLVQASMLPEWLEDC